jgi:transposase InsO family protein
MDLARYVVDAVVIEGRSARAAASAVGMSKSWASVQVARFRTGGYEALEKRSTAPLHQPRRVSAEVEDKVVLLRKSLGELGTDAGAKTIRHHLLKSSGQAPSVPTIWRVLSRRGFVVAQPHKRPRSSWARFEAALPNETWQSDMTHWALEGKSAEVVTFIDDYSRMVMACVAVPVATASHVVACFYKAAGRFGFPESVLTDNGCIYTASYRGGRCAMDTELATLGIVYKHGKPYHPQTQGKIERFHQTLKRWLKKRRLATSTAELQAQLDQFVTYYNEVRPHSARGGLTPAEAWQALDKAAPANDKLKLTPQTRVRHDKVDCTGVFTLRHATKLHHIGVGRAHTGKRVLVLVADLDIRVLDEHGEMLRHLTLDPTKDYQPITKG